MPNPGVGGQRRRSPTVPPTTSGLSASPSQLEYPNDVVSFVAAPKQPPHPPRDQPGPSPVRSEQTTAAPGSPRGAAVTELHAGPVHRCLQRGQPRLGLGAPGGHLGGQQRRP